MSQVPNILSLVRMLFVPLILWLILSNYFLLSAVVVALVGLTDYLDGYIARRYNHESLVGFYLDSIADKMLIVSIYMILGFKFLLPLNLIMLIIFREILILGSYLFGLALSIRHNIRPIFVSKLNTCVQILLIIFVCLSSVFQNELIIINIIKNLFIVIVAFTTIASSLIYIIVWTKAVNN
ncbi:MAG: CDP-alcohol phosphatidyltransferase family protein [Candidatus Pelagibacterales bacterium]|jgi:cardiolipin synthase